jgi:thiazole tautomerase (transcriptional regulator TenI)
MLPVIHAVTTDEIVARPDFIQQAAGVMRALGARGAVHLRALRTGGARLYRLAQELAEFQRTTGAWLVATDRVDLALVAGARGVQLTSRSVGVADALRFAPALAIGASVHSLADARRAAADGATWLVAGHLTEDRRGVAGPRALREVASEGRLPTIVIGGVTPGHIRGLHNLGVHGVAAIRGIWEADSAERAAAEYLAAYDAAVASP